MSPSNPKSRHKHELLGTNIGKSKILESGEQKILGILIDKVVILFCGCEVIKVVIIVQIIRMKEHLVLFIITISYCLKIYEREISHLVLTIEKYAY